MSKASLPDCAPSRATKTLRIKQIKSSIGYKYDQGQTLRSLGLGKINRVVEQKDTPVIRGMIFKVKPAACSYVAVICRCWS